jgi:hypothetical protein
MTKVMKGAQCNESTKLISYVVTMDEKKISPLLKTLRCVKVATNNVDARSREPSIEVRTCKKKKRSHTMRL